MLRCRTILSCHDHHHIFHKYHQNSDHFNCHCSDKNYHTRSTGWLGMRSAGNKRLRSCTDSSISVWCALFMLQKEHYAGSFYSYPHHNNGPPIR
eukprot:g11429.t1